MAQTLLSSRTIVIVGLANSGKTQIFNNLSGSYGVVANYPMTTITMQKGSIDFKGEHWTLFDTPGLNSLSGTTEEALVLRRAMAAEKPAVILQCIDANRLRQSLFLTAELLELGIPIVISLNIVDETAKKGIFLDKHVLSRLIGLPVIETIGREKFGMYDIKEALYEAYAVGRPLEYSPQIENLIHTMQQEFSSARMYARRLAVLALTGDEFLTRIELGKESAIMEESSVDVNRIEIVRKTLFQDFTGKLDAMLRRQTGKWVDSIYDKVVEKKGVKVSNVAERLAYASRHPVYGLIFLAAFLVLTFFSVVHAAGWLAGILDSLLTDPIITWLDSKVLSHFWKAFLIGDYGILTLGLFNAISTVLPILTVFYLLFGFLEDIGYLPNLSVLLRRSFSKFGLSGQAVMPIVLGFGCKTMATMTTRNLKSRKERLISIYLIAFAIPCSAQLSMNMAILGRAGFGAFLVAVVFLVLVELLAGMILNKCIKTDAKPVFIQELPPFRMPSLRAIGKKTLYRLWWFLKEATPVFILAALVIFFVDFFGILSIVQKVMSPIVVSWMGLPIEMVDALILMIARQEAAAGLILRLSQNGMLTAIQSIIAVVVTTMFIPCFANIVAMFKEAGWKAGVVMLIGINLTTIALAGALNWLLIGIANSL